MLKKKLSIGLLSSICFLVVLILILMIYHQNGLVKSLQQRHFKIKSQQLQLLLHNNLELSLESLNLFADPTKLGEVFLSNTLSIEDFPNYLQTGVNKIRITDQKGAILLSSDPQRDSQKSISDLTLFWINNFFTMPYFFFSNRDTLVGITQYENPYSLSSKDIGYILMEFSSANFLRQSKISQFYVRAINHHVPILLLSDTKTIDSNLADQIAKTYYNKKISSKIGYDISISNMGKILYVIDDQKYYPLSLISAMIILFLLGVLGFYRLYFLSKIHNDEQSPNFSQKFSKHNEKVNQLISDIENGQTFNKEKALSMLDNASKFGTFEEISPSIDHNTINIDIDEIHVDRPKFDLLSDVEQEFNEDEQNISKDTIDTGNFVDHDIEILNQQNDLADVLDDISDDTLNEEIALEEDSDDDILADVSDDILDDTLNEEIALEEDTDDDILADVSDDTLNEEIALEEDSDDDILADVSDDTLNEEIPLEENTDDDILADVSDDTLNEEIPLEENTDDDILADVSDDISDDTLNEEIALEEDSDDNDFNIQNFITHMTPLIEKYHINHHAFGELQDTNYIFKDTHNFGKDFIISQDDSIYKELLSQGKVLSISGNLLEIPYLDSFLSHDIQENLGELFIQPIMKNDNIEGIAILARDKNQELLTEQEKIEIFTIS